MTDHIQNLTDDALVSTLHTVTATMFDIENKKLKLDRAGILRVSANSNALTDEVERRGLVARFVNECPAGLRSRMTARGIK